MAHLYTLTGNLLAETTVYCPDSTAGETHRATAESFQVGGKGINVARMAEKLGLPATAICFPGGRTGDRCLDWLESQPFDVRVFHSAAETRPGWVVRAQERETTFLGRDREIEEKPWSAAVDFLRRTLAPGDAFAVCGSIPGWRSVIKDPIQVLLQKLDGATFTAVDTYGPPLTDLVRLPIDLIKINREELQTLLRTPVTDDALPALLRSLSVETPNVRRWVVTGSSAAVHAIDENRRPIRLIPPTTKVVSPVGCGDVLLAGLINALLRKNSSLQVALEVALPLAAANAASPEIANFDVNSI